MTEQSFYAIEDGVLPRFHIRAVKNNFKSQQQGRDVFENVEFVEILIPGDKRTALSQRVRPDHTVRFKNTYKAFKDGTVLVQGTPIDKWDILDPATKMNLKYMNIPTIESLADVPDSMLANIGMGARELRDKAKRYVSANSVDEATADLRAKNAELMARLEKLEAKAEDEPKRKGGRPRKVQEDELPPHMQEPQE